ncbi:hypothetical protein [Myxococcus sp. AM010]|uniref:hypothetical protein n=1 Tax=Myxococcus sp. AM010 TaxID=2745138 RepID=UPI0015954F1A|nr:hypothetical protein [Myxococcus sp. AM010]NVJ15506.1 hypothetical protein [Myxococcus sp. AM010]
MDVAVATAYPHRPVMAPHLMQTHTPSERFLAVAPERQAMPEMLESEQLLSVDEETRARLQRENADELAGLSLDHLLEAQSLAPNWSQSFRDWGASVYGNPSCGDPSQPAIKPCNRVERETTVVRLRATNWSGALNFAHAAHSAHWGVANCAGGSTSVGFNRFRGDSGAGLAVAPNTFYQYKLGMMHDITQNGCHPQGIDLCTPGNCTTSCFKCSGGSCN